ncbi:hypothetical protein BON22_0682 [Cyberlindnera fabianii]|uniref:Uncharacterized protein n=1 Tax=Cyberlindnera fabianii TaxID=36022 RepID=A0A1V2LE33_CYBFA|nr:hypothetical protein BON22_0682 [Cyberlindnera fabianii]
MYDGVEGCTLPILTQVERVMICSKSTKLYRFKIMRFWIAKVEDVIERHQGEKTGGLLNFNRKFHIVGQDLHKPTKD